MLPFVIPLAPGQLLALPWEDDYGEQILDDFRIVEIVACDEDRVKIVLYGDHLASVPDTLDPATLTPHRLHAAAHKPTFAVPRSEFASWPSTPVARQDSRQQ